VDAPRDGSYTRLSLVAEVEVTVEGAREEAGDLISAWETGHSDCADAVPLANVLDEACRGAGIVVFRASGTRSGASRPPGPPSDRSVPRDKSM
jgi:hypothetical protein